MAGVDIVLLKPGSQRQLYGKLSDMGLTGIEPPLWGALLAGFLREKRYSVALLDAEVEGWTYDETAAKIAEIDPLLAAVVVSGTNPSASTMNMVGAGEVLRRLRERSPGTRQLLWGLHPSALPERTLREEVADFVCQGEGFYSLPSLLDALKAGAKDFPIEGIWYLEGARVVSNPRPAVYDNLGRLPMPAWDLLPMDRYRAHNWHCFHDLGARRPYGVIYTSLGCPFRCSFCCINALFGKPAIRYRPPERVIEEIDVLVTRYGIRNIKIIDEMFVLKQSHVLALCDGIIERGYDLNMWAYARVNTVTPVMLERMRQAGIQWVCYGFESAERRVLRGAGKGYDPAAVDGAVRMTRQAGLYFVSNFVFGLPDDDMDSMRRTLDQALEINGEWANFYCAMAYPGSALYDQALQAGWALPPTWQAYSQYAYDSTPLPTKHLASRQVLQFRDDAFHAYFTNTAYLDRITRTFGQAAADHVRRMTSHRLRRKDMNED